jgi:drug/metabolite transporter (DMT)-like permease
MKLGTFIQTIIVNLSSLIACGTAFSTGVPSSLSLSLSLSFRPSVQEQQHSGRLLRWSSSALEASPSTKESPTTAQDDTILDDDAPSSVVFYDAVLDDSLPDGVVCARGVCVLEEFYDDEDDNEIDSADQSLVDKVLHSYLGPRILLAGASILYGTNFPLGVIMNEAMTPSAATSARVVLAAVALSPFLPKLSPNLAKPALLCGCFTALGYTTQSLALVDVSPATVAFLGAATVIVCPTLEAVVDKKPMGLRDSPQTWLATTLCILGVGILELYDPTGAGMLEVGWGDLLAILQAIGFGTSFFLTERMMRGQPDQALPITAVQVSVTAFICMLWCFADGWMFQPGNEAFALPGLFLEPSFRTAAFAVAWTGM